MIWCCRLSGQIPRGGNTLVATLAHSHVLGDISGDGYTAGHFFRRACLEVVAVWLVRGSPSLAAGGDAQGLSIDISGSPDGKQQSPTDAMLGDMLFHALCSNGGSDLLAVAYPGMVSPETRPGHSLTLTVDVENPPMAPEELLKRYSLSLLLELSSSCGILGWRFGASNSDASYCNSLYSTLGFDLRALRVPLDVASVFAR